MLENLRVKELEVLKVKNDSSPGKIAGAISGIVRKGNDVELQAIGAGAVNQAVKAVAIAKGFLAPSGLTVMMSPYFCDVELENGTRTAVHMLIETKAV